MTSGANHRHGQKEVSKLTRNLIADFKVAWYQFCLIRRLSGPGAEIKLARGLVD